MYGLEIADTEFKLMQDDQFVAGEFVWTGFDYLGEPAPFEQKAKSSYFGIVDLCGIPKDRYYLYRSYWRPEPPTVHILPHWNWPDRVGKVVPVFVYTNGDSAELFLNGKSLGRRAKGEVAKNSVDFAGGRPVTASSQQTDNLIDDDRGPARDVHTFAAAEIALSPPLDLGQLAVADRLEIVLVDTGEPNDVLIAHDDRRATIDDSTHGEFRLVRHTDLSHENQVERRVQRAATSAATGTPPRGSASTTGCWSLYFASAAASFRPASGRSLKGMALS